jgi:hypothetical protein
MPISPFFLFIQRKPATVRIAVSQHTVSVNDVTATRCRFEVKDDPPAASQIACEHTQVSGLEVAPIHV